VEDRRTLNGNFWVLRSGAPRRDLPESCGPHPTSYNRFVRWRRAGVWDQIMEALAVAHDAGMQDLQSRYSRPQIMSRQKIVFALTQLLVRWHSPIPPAHLPELAPARQRKSNQLRADAKSSMARSSLPSSPPSPFSSNWMIAFSAAMWAETRRCSA